MDTSINVNNILQNVLIPTEVKDEFPEERVLSVEWPTETLKTSDERIVLIKNGVEAPTAYCEWVHEPDASSRTRLAFRIVSANGELNEQIGFVLDNEKGYRFTGPDHIRLRQGRLDMTLLDFLYNYPLIVRYVSLKELEGDLLRADQYGSGPNRGTSAAPVELGRRRHQR